MNGPKPMRQVRRCRNHSAWIKLGDGLRSQECLVSNISQDGAQLFVDAATVVKDRFDLAFAPNTLRSRKCEVVWRRGRTLGVKFIGTHV